MKGTLRILVLAITLLFATTILSRGSGTEFDYFTVSAPSIALSPDESIDGFNIYTKGAVIYSRKCPFSGTFR